MKIGWLVAQWVLGYGRPWSLDYFTSSPEELVALKPEHTWVLKPQTRVSRFWLTQNYRLQMTFELRYDQQSEYANFLTLQSSRPLTVLLHEDEFISVFVQTVIEEETMAISCFVRFDMRKDVTYELVLQKTQHLSVVISSGGEQVDRCETDPFESSYEEADLYLSGFEFEPVYAEVLSLKLEPLRTRLEL